MDVPKLDKASRKLKERATEAVERVKSELSILPDRFVCPECDIPCEPSEKYDPDQAACYSETNGKVPSWRCPDCETHYRREEDGIGFDPYER